MFQLLERLPLAELALQRPGLRHVGAPEMIVERQIEDRAVHIQQDRIDLTPLAGA
jgi:hypothetical protein